jgi:predicted amidophosphoribosyltransferase
LKKRTSGFMVCFISFKNILVTVVHAEQHRSIADITVSTSMCVACGNSLYLLRYRCLNSLATFVATFGTVVGEKNTSRFFYYTFAVISQHRCIVRVTVSTPMCVACGNSLYLLRYRCLNSLATFVATFALATFGITLFFNGFFFRPDGKKK